MPAAEGRQDWICAAQDTLFKKNQAGEEQLRMSYSAPYDISTGVFWHDKFRGRQWDIIGEKFRHFPGAMAGQLSLSNVRLFTPGLASEELLRAVHTERFVDDLRQAWYLEGVLLSVGAAVEAAERILAGSLTNALVFDVAAGHHAERDSAWGGTYASAAGPAVLNARRKLGKRRIAILDTDCHHGNGTRDIFMDDTDTLHVCVCSDNTVEGGGTKVCLDAGWHTTDEDYLDLVRREFMPRVRAFQPDLIWHNFGHDTCQGDYGDRGLTPGFFPQLAREINELAREECGGRYLVLTHGGYLYEVADFIFPKIIEILAGKD